MNYKKRYLDMVARLRTRVRRMPLGSRRTVVAASIFILLVLILSIEISPFGFLIEAGKPSPRAILAPTTVQYIDKAKTREQQDAAAAAVQDVYVTDGKVAASELADIENLFNAVQDASAMPIDPQDQAATAAVRLQDKRFLDDIGALLSLTTGQRQQARDAAVQAVSTVTSKGVSRDTLALAVEEAKADVRNSSSDPNVQAAAQEVVADAVQPNLVLDRKETDRRKKAAREAIKPVITTKLDGEVLVNKGEVVTPDEVDLLKSLGFKKATFTPLNILFTAIFVLLLLGAVSMYLGKFRRLFYDSPGLLVLLGGSIVVFAAVAKVLTVAARSWSPLWGFLMPSAAIAMIVGVLFDSGTALVMVAMCGLVTGVVTGGNFSLVSLSLLGGFFPALYASRTSSRHQLRRTGLYTAFWVALVAFGATALTPARQGMLMNTGIGFLNGAVCTVIAMGSLPFLETTFRVTTNTWLLELASPDQELLEELAMKAPGTYSHSVMVANLAEAAAREIGSDPMLAKVTSYYHDVGKVKRPQFFVENQPSDSNPHEHLSPNLSTLIITSHVKDGVEMLEANHLPPDLVEIVRQHHGTSLVRYFYEKALATEEGPVDESRFRYHFPKPRRRTAGILMLADAVEAAARTLTKASPAAVEQLVERIVEGKLSDGQLDECDLTFEETTRIKKVFARVLTGTLHPRIDYPAAAYSNGRDHAGKNHGSGKVGGA
jgi:putative nucleotidyltransferase with HDIG domain